MSGAYRLHATFAQGEHHQAVLQDEAGAFFLVNPKLGSVLVPKTGAQIEALLRSPRSVGVRRLTSSALRTREEVESFLGPSANKVAEDDLVL